MMMMGFTSMGLGGFLGSGEDFVRLLIMCCHVSFQAVWRSCWWLGSSRKRSRGAGSERVIEDEDPDKKIFCSHLTLRRDASR